MADDTIYRQAAIEEAKTLFEPSNYGYMIGVGYNHAVADCIAILNNLPSAQPERKKGKWIIVTDSRGRHAECPYCGEWEYHSNQKFCGECGAQMEVEER